MPLASIDIDLIIGLFVLLSFIGRLLKSRKDAEKKDSPARLNSKDRPQTNKTPARGVTDPQAELEDFLRNLVGAPEEPKIPQTPRPIQQTHAQAPVKRSPPPPPPKPVRERAIYNPRSIKTPIMQAPVQKVAQPRQSQPMPTVRPMSLKEAARKQSLMEKLPATDSEKKRMELHRGITTDLMNKSSLRKAILLKEIIGEPLAMR